MKSYASIDRIEGSYVICEVELIENENSQDIDYLDKITEMIDIQLEEVLSCVGEVKQGDILVVEHDGKNVTQVYCKDNNEKQKRIEYLKQL